MYFFKKGQQQKYLENSYDITVLFDLTVSQVPEKFSNIKKFKEGIICQLLVTNIPLEFINCSIRRWFFS